MHCCLLAVKTLQIFSDSDLYIEVEPSQIPWVKVFTHHPYKELSQVDKKLRYKLFDTVDIIEKQMILYYNPKKINIASFGNYMPHLHIHIMARFENDQFFPQPMWGKPQRDEQDLHLLPMENFIQILQKKLS